VYWGFSNYNNRTAHLKGEISKAKMKLDILFNEKQTKRNRNINKQNGISNQQF